MPQAMTPCPRLKSGSACLYILDQGIHLCPVMFTHMYASLSAAAADPGVCAAAASAGAIDADSADDVDEVAAAALRICLISGNKFLCPECTL